MALMAEITDFGGFNTVGAFESPPVWVELNPVTFQAHAQAPILRLKGDVPPDMSARLLSYPDRQNLGDITGLVEHNFTDAASGYGAALVTVDRLNPIVALLKEGQLIEHYLHGQLAMVSIVEQWETVFVNEEEEAGELTTISGRSHLAIMETGLVYPPDPGECEDPPVVV